jgi:hypothetical protein
MQSSANVYPGHRFGQQSADLLPRALTEPLGTVLPSIKEIEAELSRDLDGTDQP